jgi:hypothetical protein
VKTRAERQSAWVETFGLELQRTVDKTGVAAKDFRVGGRASRANPNREDVGFWIREGFEQTERYIEWLAKNDWVIATLPDGRPGIEWDGEIELGGQVVRFIIDAVYITGAGELVVVDYKSGTYTPDGVEQLGLYATGLEVIFGKEWRPKWGAFYMTRKADLAGLTSLDTFGIDYFGYQFQAMQAMLDTGFFPPTVDRHCGYCSFAEFCPGVNGARASEIVLPIPTTKGK